MPLKLVRNDITRMRVGAIVNSANPEVCFGRGVDAAIHHAAGPELLEARRRIGRLHAGQVAITPAFNLPCRYVIHAVAPYGYETDAAELLRNCYAGAIALARQQGIGSLAFPLLAAGSLGCPRELALRVARETIAACLAEYDMSIYLVVFDDATFVLSQELTDNIESYIAANQVKELLGDEYGHGWLQERRRPRPGIWNNNPAPGTADAGIEHYDILPSVQEVKYRVDDRLKAEQAEEPLQGNRKKPLAMKSPFRPVKPRSLDDLANELEESFSESLMRLITQRGLKPADVYKHANLTKAHFSKIRHNPDYQPKKQTVVALAVSLRLSLDETLDLLAKAGYTLSRSSYFDLIVRYYLGKEEYDIYIINDTLFNYHQPTLGWF